MAHHDREAVPKCYYCHRTTSSLFCAGCARSSILPIRVEHATTLLDHRDLERHASAILQRQSTGQVPHSFNSAAFVNIQESAQKLGRDEAWDNAEESRYRITRIKERADALKVEMEDYRKVIQERKTSNITRKEVLDRAKKALESRLPTELETLRKTSKKISLRLDTLNASIISARAFLCREAALLAGLIQRRRRSAEGKMLEAYNISTIPILDIREFNSGPPQQITAALGNIARLLVLTCHYLHIRLPSEITLPHKQYPLATILPPTSSYQSTEPSFPGLNSSYSSNNSPRHSRTLDQRPTQKPRPLFLDHRKLPQLAKDDPNAYALFVEGVSLLAWDVIWLCRTQGLPLGSTEWEDFCNIGKNLWTLLIASPSERPSSLRKASPAAVLYSPSDGESTPSPRSLLGVYTHGTVHNFLGTESVRHSPARTVSLKEWHFASPVKLIDRIKAYLQSEMSGAEWEVVKEEEYWDAAPGKLDDTPVLVNGKGHTKKAKPAAGTAEEGSASEATGAEGSKPRGNSGWTKLRSRSGET